MQLGKMAGPQTGFPEAAPATSSLLEFSGKKASACLMLLVENIVALRHLQCENILTLCKPLIDSDSAIPLQVGPD